TNLYGYVLNDPVNLIDPNGMLPPAVWTGAVGGVVGAVAGFRNSSSCSAGGRALDTLLGAGTGFAGGFLAGVGASAAGFAPNFFTLVGGTAAGAGPSLLSNYIPSGDQLLGNSCRPNPECK
ncbi:MAG: hypothetical protein KDD22_08345, partial [Bdellovibrionales bacterium]|nr:hypothetical protein [Bdellovibrionales bacterium]